MYDFSHKYSLLDTNILTEMIGVTKRSEQFRPVFEFLKEKETSPFILNATMFEFSGYSSSKKDYERRDAWIKTFDTSPVTPPDMEMATRLSAMYKSKNPSISPKQISYIDCLHAAQLVRYKQLAFIVTTDVNDYPSFLFDMPHVIPVTDDSGTTFFVAFKTYNDEKWKALEKDFNSSG